MPNPPDATCPSCHAALHPDARYCHRCGRAVTGGGRAERTPWIVAWSTVALFLAFVVYYVNVMAAGPRTPDMANAGNAGAAGAAPAPGTPPDISQMSPRERFLRLQDRVERAAESGDSATARQFAPMAIAAYGMLDSFDVDVRFHAGIMHTELGQFPEAVALADTIEAADRGNLLGDILRIEIARARRDSTALARNRRAFLAGYDRQIARNRPEYQEHKTMLEDYHRRLAAR